MKEVVGVANSAYYKAASKTSFDICEPENVHKLIEQQQLTEFK